MLYSFNKLFLLQGIYFYKESSIPIEHESFLNKTIWHHDGALKSSLPGIQSAYSKPLRQGGI